MPINFYDLGDLVRVTGTFTRASGAVMDPAVVKCQVKTPAGVKTSYTYGVDAAMVRDSVGVYHLDVSITASGHWWYRWYSTGAGQAAAETEFRVSRSVVA